MSNIKLFDVHHSNVECQTVCQTVNVKPTSVPLHKMVICTDKKLNVTGRVNYSSTFSSITGHL